MTTQSAGSEHLEAVALSIQEAVPIPLRVAGALRELIVSGQMRPGDRVIESRIARQLGIGQPTAREALVILESEGLVRRTWNRGCTVTSLTAAEIDQIYCVRLELEPLAARLAVENAANWKPDVLRAAISHLNHAAKAGDIQAWNQGDLAFHRTLWSLTGNPFLEKALTQTCVPFFAFAELVYLQSKPQDLPSQAERHARIVTAILGADKRDAQRVTRQVLGEFRKTWRAVPGSAE